MRSLRHRLARHVKAALADVSVIATVEPSDFAPALGWYRTSRHSEAWRWEVLVKVKTGERLVDTLVGSPATMTECARKGVKMVRSKFGWEAYPKDELT